MVLRCIACGSKDIDLTIQTIRTTIPRLYCSKECMYIGEIQNHSLFGLLFFVVFFPILPVWIYFFIEARKGIKLKRQRKKQKARMRLLCYHCGKEIEMLTAGKSVCMHCGELVHFCDLCQKHILFDDETMQIEPCGHLFHKEELLEWSEKNNICPKCSVKIEFIDFQPE